MEDVIHWLERTSKLSGRRLGRPLAAEWKRIIAPETEYSS